jgi:hypothetical protein
MKPQWTTASFLLYAGGLTVLGAAVAALSYLEGSYGDAAFAGWAALVFAVLYAKADAWRRRDRWVAAGIFAFASVIAWAVFLGALWSWFGWLSHASSSFGRFSFARLSLELLVLAAAFHGRRRFRFPFIAAIAVFLGWFFVLDLLTAGGNWSAVVTLLVGLAYLLAGAAAGSRPAAFWLHFAAGALIGGSLLYWWHSTDTDWSLISVAAIVYVGIAYATKRSSWAVFAALALLAAGEHFAAKWSHGTITLSASTITTARGWAPSVVFAFVGFLLVVLGLASRRGAEPAGHSPPRH